MSYKGVDPDLLRPLSPLDLADYLSSSGWQKVDGVKGPIALFRKFVRKAPVDVAVPLDASFSDYELRMAEAVNALAQTEQISPDHLVSIIIQSKCGQGDILTSRLCTSSDFDDGLPDLKRASIILLKLTRAIEVATDFERDTAEKLGEIIPFRLAHTRAGSYCFDIVAPIVSEEDDGSKLNRKSIERIMRGLCYAEESTLLQSPDPLIKNAQNGFDAHLCKAFAELCEEFIDFDVDFSVSFSRKIPSALDSSRHRLSVESAQYLWAAAEAIGRDLEEYDDITGVVLECHDKSRISGNKGVGRPRIRLAITDTSTGNHNRIVTVYVDEARFQEALVALGTGRLVKVSGLINKTSGRWIINSAEHFEVLEIVHQAKTEKPSSRNAQVKPAEPRVLAPSTGSSLIHKLRDAVQSGQLPKRFTRTEYYNWIKNYNIRHVRGKYSQETIRKTLDNFCVGSTSGTGGPTGSLRRIVERMDGKEVTYFEFIE